MLKRISTLTAARSAGEFDVSELAELSGVPRATVQTVITRQFKATPEWFERRRDPRGTRGQPAWRYAFTALGTQALEAELDRIMSSTTFKAPAGEPGAPPLGLLRAREALRELAGAVHAEDRQDTEEHIARQLDWAHREVSDMPEGDAIRFRQELSELRAQLARALLAPALAGQAEDPAAQRVPPAGRATPAFVQVRTLGTSRGAHDLCRSVKMVVKSAAVVFNSLSGAKWPALLEGGAGSAWRQGRSARTHTLVCVNSEAGLDFLDPALREQIGRFGAMLVLDKGSSPRIAKMVQGTRASYCPNAAEDLQWVERMVGIATRPTAAVAARASGPGKRSELGVPTVHADL